jgi:UDP-N-acetyl-2-amino-2-deoxyglucuronate dehydrogenase
MSDARGRFCFAVVGAGMGAKPHALALQALRDEVAVAGVYRRDAEKCAQFCAEYGFPQSDDFDALITDPSVDALLLLTTPNARESFVAAAASAGKAILMEKPVERTLEAAERMVALCETAKVPLGIIFQHRFREGAQFLAQAVADNRFGRLEAVSLSVPWWRPQQGYYDQPGRGSLAQDGGGVLLTQAIHSLDLLLSLTGPVSSVTAMARTTRLHDMETEDFVSAGLEFANGAVGALMATTASYPGGPEMLTLNFAKASAVLTGGILTIQSVTGEVTVIGAEKAGGGGADPMAFPFDWHQNQIAEFVDAVRHGRAPLSNGHTALQVHRLIDAILRSSQQGQRVTLG